MSDKTEPPTPRRQRKARLEGDSGASVYGAQAVAFVVAVALLPAASVALVGQVRAALRRALSLASLRAPPTGALGTAALGALRDVLLLVVPLLLAVSAASAATQTVQTGGVVSVARLAPKLERLDPIGGFKRLVSAARLFAVVRALVGAAAVVGLCYVGARSAAPDLVHATGRVRSVLALGSRLGWDLCWRAAGVGMVLGLVDVIVQRRAWLRRNRMTKDEVRRERRESEGDPHVKAERERAHREIFAQAALADVRRATVVVVNPTHLACALRYDRATDAAPFVVLSGEGEAAAGIVRMARACGIPVCRDVSVARALLELSVGDVIPEALYEAVAEILREVASVEP